MQIMLARACLLASWIKSSQARQKFGRMNEDFEFSMQISNSRLNCLDAQNIFCLLTVSAAQKTTSVSEILATMHI